MAGANGLLSAVPITMTAAASVRRPAGIGIVTAIGIASGVTTIDAGGSLAVDQVTIGFE